MISCALSPYILHKNYHDHQTGIQILLHIHSNPKRYTNNFHIHGGLWKAENHNISLIRKFSNRLVENYFLKEKTSYKKNLWSSLVGPPAPAFYVDPKKIIF